MTVSRALREGTPIAAESRAHISRVAQSMGYRPDPYLRALASHRSNTNLRNRGSVIAYVTNYPPAFKWRTWTGFHVQFQGAQARAEALGYSLLEFAMSEAGSRRRVSHILHSRGVVGLILAPTFSSGGHSRLDLSQFPAITIGHSLRRPELSYAGSNHFGACLKLMHELKRRGYKRPGFATQFEHDARSEHRWSAAFKYWQNSFISKSNEIPLLLVKKGNLKQTFLPWFKRYRPDVVVSSQPWPHAVLVEKGVEVPGKCSFAFIGLVPEQKEYLSGIYPQYEEIGASAIDLLHSLILGGEKGSPKTVRAMLIDGTWNEGKTVRKTR